MADGAEEVWGIRRGQTGGLRGIVWLPEAERSLAAAERCDAMKQASPMVRRLRGMVAVIESREMRQLAAATGVGAANAFDETSWQRLFTVWMCSDTGDRRRVSIVATPDGSFWAEAIDDSGKSLAIGRVDRAKFVAIVQSGESGWPGAEIDPARIFGGSLAVASGLPGPPIAGGVTDVVPQPYLPGPVILDSEAMADRFLRGRATQLPRMDRVLRIEKLWARPPKAYTPREPAGLLVWVNSGDEGRPPESMFEVLDQANIIVAGFDNCGNPRVFTNRAQLTLDAVATISRRYHVDPRRVYIAGVSGGGRVAGMLAICFPDVFAGGFAFVGLSGFEPVTLGNGQRAAAAFLKPQGKIWDRLKGHRIAAVTGARDMNRAGVLATAQSLRAEGIDVKSFEYEDMGHTLPTGERFAEQLAWVDEPYQKTRQREIEAAERELKRSGEVPAPSRRLTDQERSSLMRVTEVGPWSSAAWIAAERLGAERAGLPSKPPLDQK